MVRVLHVVHGMNLGGIETFLMNVYRAIDRTKVQFDFLVHVEKECAYDSEILALGGKIHSVPARRKGLLKNRKALVRFFENHPEYQIVHQHVSSLSYVEPLVVAKKNGVAVRIVHSHNTAQNGLFLHKLIHKFNQKRINKIATDYFACSKVAAEWLYGKQTINYKIIPNGINLKRFYFSDMKRLKIREEFNIGDAKLIGHIGRFTEQKNHEYLIDIFHQINKVDRNTILLLVGEGKLVQHIKEKVNQLGLANNVIFAGSRSDVENFYSGFDCLLFPSLHEGFPVVLVEAQASGLPCFVSSKITKACNLSNYIYFISLDQVAKNWALQIIGTMQSPFLRKFPCDKRLEQFDITSVIEMLTNIYLDS